MPKSDAPVRNPPAPTRAPSRKPFQVHKQRGLGPWPVVPRGQPLSPATKQSFERRLGVSLDNVRIHTGAAAEKMADSFDADAVTIGHDIAFAQGKYETTTIEGRARLAHEVVHVVQQQDDLSEDRTDRPAPAESRAEQEAELAAGALALGASARIVPGSAPAGVYRQAKGKMSGPQVKKSIRDRNVPAITEIVDKLPNAVWDGKPHTVKTADIDGKKHEWQLTVHLGKGPAGSTITGITGEKDPVEGAVVVHPIQLILFEGSASDETFFHELVHARILIDRSLPRSEQSAVFVSYMHELIRGATAEEGARKRMIERLNALREFFRTTYPTLTAKIDAAPELSMVKLIEFLANERFTNKMTKTAFGRSIDNRTIARRYARSVSGKFEGLVTASGLPERHLAGVGGQMLDSRVADLERGLDAWFAATDKEKQTATYDIDKYY